MRSATILVLAFALLVCLALLFQSRRRYGPYRPYRPYWRREGFSGTFGPAFNGAFAAGGSDFGSYNVENKKNQSSQ